MSKPLNFLGRLAGYFHADPVDEIDTDPSTFATPGDETLPDPTEQDFDNMFSNDPVDSQVEESRKLPSDALTDLSDDEILARHRFVDTIAQQYGIEDKAARVEMARGFARYRANNRMAYYDRGQVEGWRLAGIIGNTSRIANRHEAVFFGVTDEGALIARKVIDEGNYFGFVFGDVRDDKKPESRVDIDWTVKDPLSVTQDLARVFAPGSESWIGNGCVLESASDNDIPLHYRNRSFSACVDRRQKEIEGAVYTRDGPRAAFSKISHTAKREEIRRYAGLARALQNAVDPEARRMMHGTASWSHGMVNYLAGAREDGEKANATRARNRRQALNAFPLFTAAIKGSPKLTTMVDEGEPLAPALADYARVPQNHMARLRGVTWQKAGRHFYHNPSRLGENLRHIDPNHVPETRRGFADMEVAIQAADITASFCSDRTVADTCKEIGGRFDKIAAQAEGNPVSGIVDLAHSLNEQLATPAYLQELVKSGKLSEKEALDEGRKFSVFSPRFSPLKGVSVRQALSNSERWHRNLPRLEAALSDDDEKTGERWAPLAEDGRIDLGKGIYAQELNSRTDLLREGREQNHCVGGYTSDVLSGRSLIYSIRKEDGKTLSTVEFGQFGVPLENRETGKRTYRPEIAQHYGYGNADPSKLADQAVNGLKRKLGAMTPDAWSGYLEKLAETDRIYQSTSNHHPVVRNAGYDPFDRKKLETAWEELSPYLARPDRKKGLDGWIKDRIQPHAKETIKEVMNDSELLEAREVAAR